MESTNDQQTPPTISINNSSSRRKQSKPNRLEHVVTDNPSTIPLASDSGNSSSILPPLTQYHVAAEQQTFGSTGIGRDDECDRVSLNCEDGSLSSQSTGEHYTIDDGNHRTQTELTSTNDEENRTFDSNEHLFNSTNRSRSLNPAKKSRSLKRKHSNGNLDPIGTMSTPTRIFHADAFCAICRKEFCNKYFLKTHLANKHGIFDPQSVGSASSKELTDTTNDSNLQQSFAVISTLIGNDQDELVSSPSSDITQTNHDNELGSLRLQMNGVIAGDDDDEENQNQNNNNNHNDEDDEQDGIGSNRLVNLPQQIASILSNENTNLKTDDDQRVITSNSPTNNLDFQSTRQSSTKILEDFCDICQKHFCNKYYLRKHKLDVHGVQTDCNIKPYKRIDNSSLSIKNSPPSTATPQISPFPNVTFKPSSVQQSLGLLLNPIFSPLVQSATSTDQQNLLTNKRRYTDSSNDSSSSKCQYLSSDVANVLANQLVTNNSKSQISTCTLCGKKFQSNDYLQLHLMNKHQIKTDIQQRTNKLTNFITISNQPLNSNTYKKIKLEPNETTAITSIIKSPASPNDANSSIVMPGIVDTYFAAKMADRVSCDICHKQVCNKYFLKTHKLKVHGVGPDPLGASSNASEAAEEENDQQQSSNNSPPQLVVDERSTEPGVIPSPDALTASVNTFIGTTSDSNEQITCDLCSKTFPSKFLLHIHMTNVHGIQQTTSTANGTTITTTAIATNNKSQLINAGIQKPIINGNSSVRLKQTPQVQLRVTCQVCKKELCNKYFLRAHMRNVHNISVDDLRLIQQQQSSSTSQSSPNSDKQSTKQVFSQPSNILSPTSTIPTDSQMDSTKYSSSNDNALNGHQTDSDESENISSSNDNNNNHNQLLSMQPFLVESDDDLYKDLFVPCMVYLPCRHRVTKPLEISLRLKPVDNTSTTNVD
ncbi:unnamed protein product [Adineta ricciae]|uniref:C2H2-type domain-containing protein n=1 Tax=Adineta ricciae TaxID=249248 RepID=A0A816E3B6_ADIRI|nr:unnamed protein product [Adineta ricciae]